jgi:hypothetical protein
MRKAARKRMTSFFRTGGAEVDGFKIKEGGQDG